MHSAMFLSTDLYNFPLHAKLSMRTTMQSLKHIKIPIFIAKLFIVHLTYGLSKNCDHESARALFIPHPQPSPPGYVADQGTDCMNTAVMWLHGRTFHAELFLLSGFTAHRLVATVTLQVHLRSEGLGLAGFETDIRNKCVSICFKLFALLKNLHLMLDRIHILQHSFE